MRRLVVVLFLALGTQGAAAECVSVDSITAKAAEFKRPFAFIERGEILDGLMSIHASMTGAPSRRIAPSFSTLRVISSSACRSLMGSARFSTLAIPTRRR